MILRQVRRLEPGMSIRLSYPKAAEPLVYNVRSVDPHPEPQRWAIGFGFGDDDHRMNFFPDDLVEIII